MTDPMTTRIVEVGIGVDAMPLLVVDGVPVDLAPGDDPEQVGMSLVADVARRSGRSISAVLVLDGGSTRWRVQVHPDGTVTEHAPTSTSATSAPRRRRPAAWLAGVAALVLLAGGGFAWVTVSTSGSDPGAPAASGTVTTSAERPVPDDREEPTSVPAPAIPTVDAAPVPEPSPVLAAPVPDSAPSSVPRRELESDTDSRPAPSAAEADTPPLAAVPVSDGPDEQPTPPDQDAARAAESFVEQDPTATAQPAGGTGSSQRARSQRPPSSAPATTGVSSSQRAQSGS